LVVRYVFILPIDLSIPLQAETLQAGQNAGSGIRNVARGIQIIYTEQPGTVMMLGIQVTGDCRV